MAAGFISKALATLAATTARWVEFADASTAPVHGSVQLDSSTGLALDTSLPAEIVGSVAHDAVDTGKPVKIGGVYKSAPSAVVDGDRVDLLLGTKGHVPLFSSLTPFDGVSNASAAANIVEPAAGGARYLTNWPYKFNGTSWDRDTKPNATKRLPSSAATTNADFAKASAGALHMLTAYNSNAAVRYLKLYNKASAPTVGTDVPVLTIPLPPTSVIPPMIFPNGGLHFSTGISFALTTGAADADTGAVGAGDILGLNIAYS